MIIIIYIYIYIYTHTIYIYIYIYILNAEFLWRPVSETFLSEHDPKRLEGVFMY